MKKTNKLFIYLPIFIIVLFASTINLYSQNNNSDIIPHAYSGIYEGVIDDLWSCSGCIDFGFGDCFGDICIYYEGDSIEVLYDGSELWNVNFKNGVVYNKENKEIGRFANQDAKIVFLFKKSPSKYNVLIKIDSADAAKNMIDKYIKESKEFIDFWPKFKQIVRFQNEDDFIQISNYPVILTEAGSDYLKLLSNDQELDYLIKKIFNNNKCVFDSDFRYFRFRSSNTVFAGCFLVPKIEYYLLFKKIGSEFKFVGSLNPSD